MKTNTLQLQKTLLKVFPNKYLITAIEVLFLLMVGALAITIHSKLKIPIHLSGKHGMLFMFLVILGSSFTSIKYSVTICTLGASALLFSNTLGFTDPLRSALYILIGFAFDFLINVSLRLKTKLLYIAFVSGISYMLIPIVRMIFSLSSGFVYPSLLTGMLFPVFTHFVFAFTGGLLAVIAIRALNKKQ